MVRRSVLILIGLLLVSGLMVPSASAQPSFPAAPAAPTQTGAQSPSESTGAQSPSATTGARSSSGFSLKRIVDDIVVPTGDIVIQVLYALSFVFFLYGIVRLYFAEDEKQRAAGKLYAFWGILGIAVLFAVWGIVNVLLNILTEFAA